MAEMQTSGGEGEGDGAAEDGGDRGNGTHWLIFGYLLVEMG